MAASESPLVPGSPHAGGALVAIDPDGQQSKLTLRKYHVDVHIEDGFARTTIDQKYFNHADQRLEGTFYFPLPADASLSRLAMYVNGTLMEGGMAERDYARNVYERILYQQKDPALLEWVDGSTFKMRVFPLEPREEKRIILSYTQKLPALYGQTEYRFPAGHSLERVKAWSFHALVKHGADRPWTSPSHTLKGTPQGSDLVLDTAARDARLDRDVVLRLTEPQTVVRFCSAELDGQQYLMVRFRPSLPIEKQKGNSENPRHWVVLFESSGDRDPLLGRTQIDVIRHLLRQAGTADTFSVLTAGTRVRAFAAEPLPVTPKNVQDAALWLEKSHLVGALDLGRALTEAEAVLKKSPNAYLVHVGSGIAAMGERRAGELVKHLPEGARYVGVGVGRRWDRAFMKMAAERTGGYFTQINPDEPVAWRAFDLFATLNTTRLQIIRVDCDTGVLFLTFTCQLAQGEELAAVARVGADDKGLPTVIKVLGKVDGKPFEQTLPVKDVAKGAGYLPRMWARLEIDRLLAADPEKHKEAIVALSKQMYVMTPFTSLLVLENEEMHVQFKVDRGRKDHWAMYPCPKKVPVLREGEAPRRADGRKPTKQVIETIVVREALHILKSLGNRISALRAFRGPTQTDVVGSVVINTASRLEDPNGYGHRGILGGKFEDGALTLNKPLPPRLHLILRQKEQFDLDMLNDTDQVGPSEGADQQPAPPKDFESSLTRRTDDQPRLAMMLPRGKVAVGIKVDATATSSGMIPPGSRVDVIAVLRRGEDDSQAMTILENVPVLAVTAAMTRSDGTSVEDSSGVTLGLNPEEAEVVALAQEMGSLRLVLRPDGDSNPNNRRGDEASRIRQRLLAQKGDSLLYQKPTAGGDDRVFYDLAGYARGMNTTAADIDTVLEAEGIPNHHLMQGAINEAARRLIHTTRAAGWQALTQPAEDGRRAYTIFFDGRGRYTYERVLPPGLRERVICDGRTLLHLYPDLGIGARRTVSRFHRADFARLVPWVMRPAEDLAIGADVRLIDEQTVAVVPHGVDSRKDKNRKPLPYLQLRLVFAEGRLAERQIVRMPAGQVVSRHVLAADGTIKFLDSKGKEVDVLKARLAPAREPSLKADTENLVILRLPYRTREHVLQTRKLKDKPYESMRFADARALFAADVAAGNGESALAVFKQAFYARDQRQLGFYVLLAACGQNLDADHVDVMAEHPDEPLAQYLALHTSPLLRKHASQWAVASRQWPAGLLRHLALTHALAQRWQSDKVTKGTVARVQAERDRALDYVRQNRGTLFGWAMLGLVQDQAKDDKAFHRELAGGWLLFEDVPGLAYPARYEYARSLLKCGQAEEARKVLTALYEKTLKAGRLPPIDADFRRALLTGGKGGDAWSGLLRRTADQYIQKKDRPAVLALAWQCWQLEDRPLANHLLTLALDGIPAEKDRLALTLAGVGFLSQTGQLAEADQLLQKLLKDSKLAERPSLWRIKAKLAEQRDQAPAALEALEQALETEYQNLPEVIDLRAVRADYEKLLEHYQKLTEAMVTLKVRPPADFLPRVVRAADRWRAMDRDGTAACRAAGRILQTLGDRDLGWDYLTTPIGLRPNEADPWLDLARTLSRQGDLELADRAYTAAFEAEPTNAQILWDRAQNLRQAGKTVAAKRLLRQLVDRKWQPRFEWLRTQARWEVRGR
jgi:tetratricopeptide (TPR) repeat protein